MIRKKQGSNIIDRIMLGASGSYNTLETRFANTTAHTLPRDSLLGRDCVQPMYVTNDQNQGQHDN